MNAYVIKSWTAAETPNANGNYVHIAGRTSGFISWLLNLMGISPTIELTVTGDLISLRQGSWGGTVQYHTPLENLCTTCYGYTKPWRQALILGMIVGLATFFLLGIPGLLAGILYYFLNKITTVGYTDMGGRASHIHFKRSVIEGQKLDEDAASEVCRVIQSLVERRTGARLAGTVPPRASERPVTAARSAREPACEKSARRDYYYADAQGQPKGPFIFDELVALAASGEIKSETFVVAEGAPEWSRWDALNRNGSVKGF